MPIKSQAQRRKFAQLLVDGEITPEVFERWNREAGSAELPERLHPKPRRKKARKKAKARTKPKRKAARRARKPAARRRTR